MFYANAGACNFRIEGGGGDGDNSTHSSSSSPVCQAGKAAEAMMRGVILRRYGLMIVNRI
jgi:hypothetical protein